MITGERTTYTYETDVDLDDLDRSLFIWEDGNYPCDCNRSMFMYSLPVEKSFPCYSGLKDERGFVRGYHQNRYVITIDVWSDNQKELDTGSDIFEERLIACINIDERKYKVSDLFEQTREDSSYPALEPNYEKR
ncbi:MAG: hypothetical protein GY861_22140 [bacterium]|nr:hypothetical protein [bacterium]